MTKTTIQKRDRSSTPHRAVAIALTVGSLLLAGSARAQETTADVAHADAPEASTHYAIGAEAYAGNYGVSGGGGGMALAGLGVVGHYGILEGGALYENGFQMFGSSMSGKAGLLGVGWDVTPHFRVSLLGELGMHEYRSEGAIFLTPTGSNATLGYAGGRLGGQWSYGGDVRFTLGLWLFVRDDLTRTQETVTYRDEWSGGSTTTTNALGQWQTGLALRLGIEGGSF